MSYYELKDISPKEIIPGFHGKMIHGEKMTMGYWDIDEGAVLPEHSHAHEQSSTVIEGEFEMTVDGQTHILKPGSVMMIPSNSVHSGRAITRCKIVDVFAPVREDYT